MARNAYLSSLMTDSERVRFIRGDADFDESKIERDEGGKFSSSGGGASGNVDREEFLYSFDPWRPSEQEESRMTQEELETLSELQDFWRERGITPYRTPIMSEKGSKETVAEYNTARRESDESRVGVERAQRAVDNHGDAKREASEEVGDARAALDDARSVFEGDASDSSKKDVEDAETNFQSATKRLAEIRDPSTLRRLKSNLRSAERLHAENLRRESNIQDNLRREELEADGQTWDKDEDFGRDEDHTPGYDLSDYETLLREDSLLSRLPYLRTLMSVRRDNEWDPDDHPKGPDGKFVEAGGGSSAEKTVVIGGQKYKLKPGGDPYLSDDYEPAENFELKPGTTSSKFEDSGEGVVFLAPKQKHEGKSNDPHFRAARAKYFANRVEKYRERIKNAKSPEEKAKHQKTLMLAMKQLERNVKAAQKFAKNAPDGQKAADAAKKLHAEVKAGTSSSTTQSAPKDTFLEDLAKKTGGVSTFGTPAEFAAKEKPSSGKELTPDEIKAAGLQHYPGQKITDEGDHLIVNAISGAKYKVDKSTMKWTTLTPKPSKPAPTPKQEDIGPPEYVSEPDVNDVELNGKLQEHQASSKMSLSQFQAERSKLSAALSPDQKSAALAYSGAAYSPINSGLRNGSIPSNYKEEIKALDSMFDRPDVVTKQDMIVSRGMGSAALFDGKAAGDEFVDPGFMSTSVSSGFGGSVRLQIHVPSGSRAAAIPSHSPAENEILLPRNTRLEILKIEKQKVKTGSGMTKTKIVVFARAHTNDKIASPSSPSSPSWGPSDDASDEEIAEQKSAEFKAMYGDDDEDDGFGGPS